MRAVIRVSVLAASVILISVLTGCGGGGESTAAPQVAAKTVLEGTWIAASDNRPTGGACGLTLSGDPGERKTVTFSANTYIYKFESCAILTGNTGGYLTTDSSSGTFSIGGIALQSADPTSQMTALNLTSQTTSYTSFNISGNKLHIAGPFQTFDGSTPEKRAFQINTYFDTSTRKLVENAAFLKQ